MILANGTRRRWVWAPVMVLALAMCACSKNASDKTNAAPASASGAAAPSEPAGVSAIPLEATKAGGPKRADGFWESAWGEATVQYCVGDNSEEKYSLVDDLSLLGECSKKEFKRTPGGWAFETVCADSGVTTTQKGTITGDFRTRYVIDQVVTQTPGGSTKGQIIARRIGDCPAPYKPGDKVKSGMSINMLKFNTPATPN